MILLDDHIRGNFRLFIKVLDDQIRVNVILWYNCKVAPLKTLSSKLHQHCRNKSETNKNVTWPSDAQNAFRHNDFQLPDFQHSEYQSSDWQTSSGLTFSLKNSTSRDGHCFWQWALKKWIIWRCRFWFQRWRPDKYIRGSRSASMLWCFESIWNRIVIRSRDHQNYSNYKYHWKLTKVADK